MAGTDHTQTSFTDGPAIVLAEPQLAENIGMAARAMANFGLSEMRLVNPRDGWPNEAARKAASGADWVVDQAKVYDRIEDAIADLGLVLATTARDRAMTKPVWGPEKAVSECRVSHAKQEKTGILFGRERWGLNNDEIALADAIVTYPVNPAFASLNIAQAVLLFGYVWFSQSDAAETMLEAMQPDMERAPKSELIGFFEHLEDELDRGGFLKPPEKRPRMVQNLRSMFQRAALTSQDVRTLRGVIVALTNRKFKTGEPVRADHPALVKEGHENDGTEDEAHTR